MTLIERNKNPRRKGYILWVICVLSIIGVGIFESIKVHKSEEVKLKSEFHGVVEEIYPVKSEVIINIADRDGSLLLPRSFNHAYQRDMLVNFIEVGDTVIKKECSDSILVTRDNKEYLFLMWADWFNHSEEPNEEKISFNIARAHRYLESGCRAKENIDEILYNGIGIQK